MPGRPSREQMIADLQAAQARPSREQMLADLQAAPAPEPFDTAPKTLPSGAKVAQRWKDVDGSVVDNTTLGKMKAIAGMGQTSRDVQQGIADTAPIQGDVPLVVPGGAIPKLAKAATALAEGQGIGYAAGRTALSAGQGALMSAFGGKPGESWADKLDRIEHGAKLSGGIQAAAEAVPYVGKALGYAGRKLGAAVSGVDESIIKNYADRTDEVNNLIKQSGGDVTAAADQVRTELSSGIQKAKGRLNGQITSALEKGSQEPSIPVSRIVDSLEAAKAKLNPNLKAGAIAEIDDMIATVKREAGPTAGAEPMVNASSLYQLKQFLNEGASPAYNKGGQIFTRAGEAARAARDAANEAREMLKGAAPDISAADGQLSRLHGIERRLNKNLLAPGKPDAALMSAGAGANPRNAANLRALEEVSGVPVTQRAKDLATVREFANPTLLPTDYTGKAVARQAGAALLGTAVGGPVGGMVGGALASPMAVKVGVNVLRGAKDVAEKLPNVAETIRRNPITATAATQFAAKQIRDANAPSDQSAPKLLQAEPKSGPDRWAAKGLEKLGITDSATREKLLASKEGKQLLIEASDLSPDSPAMKRIKEQIKKGWDANATRTGTSHEILRQQREPARGR